DLLAGGHHVVERGVVAPGAPAHVEVEASQRQLRHRRQDATAAAPGCGRQPLWSHGTRCSGVGGPPGEARPAGKGRNMIWAACATSWPVWSHAAISSDA